MIHGSLVRSERGQIDRFKPPIPFSSVEFQWSEAAVDQRPITAMMIAIEKLNEVPTPFARIEKTSCRLHHIDWV
jgi:hypothetical protein